MKLYFPEVRLPSWPNFSQVYSVHVAARDGASKFIYGIPLKSPKFTFIHKPNWGKLLVPPSVQLTSIIQIYLQWWSSENFQSTPIICSNEGIATIYISGNAQGCLSQRNADVYPRVCIFKWESHKTLPQSLEVFKMEFSMSVAEFISSIINQSKFPELWDQLLWMPLNAQTPSAESVRYGKTATPNKPT